MKTTRALVPHARQDELVVEKLPDETLVYDLKRHKAHCLNRTAALVWQHCDGQTSVAEIATLLEEQLATPADEAVVWMALDRLERAHLLQERGQQGAETPRYSRRQVVRRLGQIGIAIPMVVSIVAPRAAHAASCITLAECIARLFGPCGGEEVCGTGQCCKPDPDENPPVCDPEPC